MTLCNICLRETKTTFLDRLDLCKSCMEEVKERLNGKSEGGCRAKWIGNGEWQD